MVSNGVPTPAMLRQRKTQKKGIKFTVMLCGSGGSGKSTFINTLCQQQVIAYSDLNRNIPRAEIAHQDPGITLKDLTVELPDEGNGILSLKFIDTPGFGDNMDNMASFNEISNYIDRQFDDVLAEESRVKRNPRFADNRVHALIYFINPTSHGLTEPDVEFMRMMAPKVNILPVIAKSDSLTPEELALNKSLIMEDIRHYQLAIYGFPGGDGFLYDSEDEQKADSDAETSSIIDEEFNELNSYIRTKLPFAVIGANEIIDAGTANQIQARRYPWGVLDVNNPDYSDVELLRDIITRTHLQDLKETTHFILYENYRTRKLSSGLPSSIPATPVPESADSTSTKVDHLSAFKYNQQFPFSPPYTSASVASESVISMTSRDSTTAGTSETNDNALLAREEQLRASEIKLRLVESKVQQEILQKRQELLARERELKELEAKLKTDAEALRSNVGSPNPSGDYAFGNGDVSGRSSNVGVSFPTVSV